jgi:hypothetical protein
LLKISLACAVTGVDPAARARKVEQVLVPALRDLEISEIRVPVKNVAGS